MTEEKQLTIDQAHRYFGVAFNNKIFKLAAKEVLSNQEKEEIVASAHASFLHWQASSVWKEVNTQRAYYMLAKAYLRIEDKIKALEYANKCLEYTKLHQDKLKDFDLVYCHEIVARAASLNKDRRLFKFHLNKIETLLPLIENAEDKNWVQTDLDSGNWFGMKK